MSDEGYQKQNDSSEPNNFQGLNDSLITDDSSLTNTRSEDPENFKPASPEAKRSVPLLGFPLPQL